MVMKIKTIIIFPNGSVSFYKGNMSLTNSAEINQHIFVKKGEKAFFFADDITVKPPIYNQSLDNRNKYFK
jgi:hypothetical protein